MKIFKPSRKPLYPVMETTFTLKKQIKKKGRVLFNGGIEYYITGWGYGEKEKDKPRKEFWVVSQRKNPMAKTINRWKSDVNLLYDKGVISVIPTIKFAESKKHYY